MTNIFDELEITYRSRLKNDYPEQSQLEQDSIVSWLLGEKKLQLDQLTAQELKIIQQGIEFRYGILCQRYLKVSPTQAYRNLMNRLGSLVMLRQKIASWIAMSRDRQRAVVDVLQEVIQELLNSDRYIQQQSQWIAQCTKDTRLRDSLLLTTIEEYCLRRVRNQPLLVYRFVNFLRSQSRAGVTNVPRQEMLRLVSDEINPNNEDDSSLSLLDNQAINSYQEQEQFVEKEALRLTVQKELETYLEKKLDGTAVQWLRLYLQGYTPDAIAETLNLPIKQIYRLREKVTYHALQVFAIKEQPELIANWLEISLKEHNLGLTPQKWEIYWQKLTPIQQQIITNLKADKTLEEIAQELGWKTSQVIKEWSNLYQSAQVLRN